MSVYRNHDSLPVLESEHYLKHVSAMTKEDLHFKADIAEELASRDIQIEELKQQRDHLERENAKQGEMLNSVVQQRDELLEALKEIGNTSCGEASHQYMALSAIDAAMGEKL